MRAVYEKELRSYFSSMTGYVFMAALLLLCGGMSAAVNLFRGLAAFENTLYTVSYVFIFTVPLLTMGVGADERKNKTETLLRALPVFRTDIVFGKYLALLTVFAVPCLVMCLFPAVLSTYGEVNFISAYGSILGFFLLGACLLALGLAVSFAAESPTVAGVVTFLSVLLTYLFGSVADLVPSSGLFSLIAFLILALLAGGAVYYLLRSLPLACGVFGGCALIIGTVYLVSPAAFEGAFGGFLRFLGVYERFTVFLTGLFDLSGVVYFLSFTALCLVIATQVGTEGKKDLRLGSVRLLITCGALACAVVLNVAMGLLPEGVKKQDMSASGMFKISPETLESLTERENIEITYLVSEGEEDLLTEQMLIRVDEQCDGIALKRLDPALHPEAAADYSAYTANSFIVKSPLRERAVSAYDLYEFEFEGYDGQRFSYLEYSTYKSADPTLVETEYFVGEKKLLSAMSYVTARTLPTVLFTTGHGESEPDGVLLSYLDQDNVQLSSVNLSTLTEIPEEVDTIVTVYPKGDFSAVECLMLKSFINSGGHVVLYTEFESETLTNLEGLLGELGMKRVDGLVYDGEEGRYAAHKWLLMPATVENEFTEGIDTGVFMPIAHGIELCDTDDEVTVRAILNSSDESFARPSDSEAKTNDKSEGDIDGPFMLGADSAYGEGSLTWYGSPYLVVDETFNYDGVGYMVSSELFLNTVEKNCEIDLSTAKIADMKGKQTAPHMLSVPNSEKGAWTAVFAVILPLSVLLYGALRIRKRRRA